MLPNKELQRSQFAFKKVISINNAVENANSDEEKKNREKEREDYSNYARKFSTMIHTNGLVATVAFCRAKKKGYAVLLAQLSEWLTTEQGLVTGEHSNDLLQYLLNCNSQQVLLLTYESMAIGDWLKRMVEALMPEI